VIQERSHRWRTIPKARAGDSVDVGIYYFPDATVSETAM
jgi:hypothetical protein